MSQTIKFTEQEIAEIRNIQSGFQQKVVEFGRYKLERIELRRAVESLEARETKTEQEYEALQKSEGELLDKLTKKYGEGSLDLTDGTFTSNTPPSNG